MRDCRSEFTQMGAVGFEPTKAEPPDLQSGPFGHSGTRPSIRFLGDWGWNNMTTRDGNAILRRHQCERRKSIWKSAARGVVLLTVIWSGVNGSSVFVNHVVWLS